MTVVNNYRHNAYATTLVSALVKEGAFASAKNVSDTLNAMYEGSNLVKRFTEHLLKPAIIVEPAVTPEAVKDVANDIQNTVNESEEVTVEELSAIDAVKQQAEELGVDVNEVVMGVLNAAFEAMPEKPATPLGVVEEDNDYLISSVFAKDHVRIVPNIEVYNAKKKELIAVANKLNALSGTEDLSAYNEPIKHLRGMMRKLAIKSIVSQSVTNDIINHFNEMVDAYGNDTANGCACFLMKMHFKSMRKILDASTDTSEMVKHLYFAAATVQLYRTLNNAVASITK